MENIKKMKDLVEISKIVTGSDNFYEIKDIVINKMLSVVHPTKACVNLFYGDDYSYAHLVCSATLDYIPTLFPQNEEYGSKIDFDLYPKYIHEAVREKKQVIVENIFEYEGAKGEEMMALNEKYVGRAVFPFVLENRTIGFMSCYIMKGEKLEQDDIDFISQVASLLTLSISITEKNDGINKLVDKLRSSMNNINKASMEIYSTKNLDYYLNKMTSVLLESLNSEFTFIRMVKKDSEDNIEENVIDVVRPNSEKDEFSSLVTHILNSKKNVEVNNNGNFSMIDGGVAKCYLYKKFIIDSKTELVVGCIGSAEYSNDDRKTISILARQIYLNIQTYEHMKIEEKHKDIENELSILKKQQKLIMDCCSDGNFGNKEMYFYQESAKVVGGDFYNAIDLGDKVVFIVADVMGHGVASNYIVALLKGAFNILIRYSDSPKEILRNLNQYIYKEFDEIGMYATALVGIFDKYNEKMTISNAGHYYPIVIDKKGRSVDISDGKQGLPVGVLENSSYNEIEINLNDKDSICFFTDGILEMKNDLGEEFGLERLERFLLKNINKNKENVIRKIKADIQNFGSNREKQDDILVVFFKNKIEN